MGHLAVRGLRLRAGARVLLDDVTFAVAPGELLAVVGANGVGKTTLLRTLAGFIRPEAGDVALDGAPVGKLARPARARAVTLIGDNIETPHGMSVREVVLTGRFARRDWWDWTVGDADLFAADAALERVGLSALRERPFDTLSSGERQRAWLALALAQDVRVVLLDEPTSHLDIRHAAEIAALLRNLVDGGRCIVAVLHDLNEAAAIADRIAVLGDGTLLACDAPRRALDPATLERAFGIPFRRLDIDGETRVLPGNPRVATAPA